MGQSRQDLVAMFIEWSFFVVEWIVLRAFSSMLMDLLNLFPISEINLTERGQKMQMSKI
jgi:hypothetical protein